MSLRRAALAVLAVLAASSPALAEERITSFASNIRVNKDASVDVTETIDVVAENVRINHGIFRDFPTRYRTPGGLRIRVGFTFGGATLDGESVAAATEPLSNGIRIKMGDPYAIVAPGEHRYVIRYHVTREIGRFADYDELYWNVTGNGWIFPIDRAQATVHLPAGAIVRQHAAYTGAQGSTASNAAVSRESEDRLYWRTTAPLGSYEGLTIAVAWQKGIISEPDQSTRAGWWLSDNGPPLVGAAGLIGLCIFYFLAWQRAGRNPRAGTIVPAFSPPDDLSPAAMRYVWKMGLDNRAFAAALVDMGVKGHIRLEEEDGGFFGRDKTRIHEEPGREALPAPEAEALRKLLGSSSSITMEQKNHAYFGAARKALDEAFKKQFEGKLFKRNWGWAVAGILLWIAVIWLASAAVLASVDQAKWPRIGVALGAAMTAGLLAVVAQHSSSVGKCLLVLGIFVFTALSLVVGVPVLANAFATGWLLPMLLPALSFPLVFSAFIWIAAPTREGRAVLDRIMGFRQYLSIAERPRLDRMMAPEDTPALFERYLPYAIALGVENRWADRFSGVLAAAAAQGQQGFTWYAGHSDPWNDVGGFVGTVGSSLSSSVSSASTAPGSSSGSGGGGSSGGGGGGGGGGGW